MGLVVRKWINVGGMGGSVAHKGDALQVWDMPTPELEAGRDPYGSLLSVLISYHRYPFAELRAKLSGSTVFSLRGMKD
jgi:hypothetical protein